MHGGALPGHDLWLGPRLRSDGTEGRPRVGEGSYGLMDRWRALSTKTQLLVMVVVTAAVGFVIYLGAPSDPDSESPTRAGLAACVDAMQAMNSASDKSRSVTDASGSMAAAGERLAPVAADYPRLATVVLAIEQARKEVVAGQPNGPFGQALARECQSFG